MALAGLNIGGLQCI